MALIASMILAACGPTSKVGESGVATPQGGTPVAVVSPKSKDADTYVVVTGAGEPESLDPAWTYEIAGSAIEANIYDGLVWYNKGTYDEFIPA